MTHDEVKNIKAWLQDERSTQIPALQKYLWNRRDNILFNRGFLSGTIVAWTMALIILAVTLRFIL